MIRFENLSVTYAGAAAPVLRDVDAHVEEGELCLVVGPTGSGKSTLLGAAAGRVPHFTGGEVAGRVLVEGRDTRDHLPRDLADVVGIVAQDPLAGFVTDTVEEELAFGMEQIGVDPALMRKRVEEVLDLLGLAGLRDRALADLSGGEQQRVAIGAVLTAQPRVLVLDEPTSALDPAAAEDVLAALARLVHDVGITVLLAEHRLERVVQFADRVIALGDDGTVVSGPPAQVLAGSAVAPPVVELGRLAGWDPLPLSVRDARRLAAPLRERLLAAPQRHAPERPTAEAKQPLSGRPTATAKQPLSERRERPKWSFAVADEHLGRSRRAADDEGRTARSAEAPATLTARGLAVRHGAVDAVRGADLTLHAGEIVALMGRNGSGKSSLLWALQGQGPRSAGIVHLAGPDADPATLTPAAARRHVALVPQSPSDLLYLPTVGQECAAADEQVGAPAGTTRDVLHALAPGVPGDAHPRDLSEGQRLALALAIQLAGRPMVLLLDEPTRGLDYTGKARLADLLRTLRSGGRTVLLATHDVEFVAGCADRVVLLAGGDLVADAPARSVLHDSATFSPQVAKILRPVDVLTVADVRDLLVRDVAGGSGRDRGGPGELDHRGDPGAPGTARDPRAPGTARDPGAPRDHSLGGGAL
ncbi:energy-coupling factor transport system ATP-binding protein [Georgenia soli]|uniref:Energy-coupling factor transport system ATP-binding protein n=1 Tax=Georgenia soli TaxID=638953 RepID=A0A2A9ELP0_9MICO|nr:ABC transporter ATP-binding protein [Georgenia soli]PFG39884.1 energy-coupling factor transport system ATP-binding protein [Georgenia soli]